MRNMIILMSMTEFVRMREQYDDEVVILGLEGNPLIMDRYN